MPTRDDWIDEGLRVLAADGLPGVRIDRIAARLGASKGSFHHHFDGAQGYRRALAERFEARAVGQLQGLDSGPDAFAHLVDRLEEMYDPPLETAMRAWAMHDDTAREIVSRVDAARLDALTRVWAAHVDDPRTAHLAALVPHLVVVGASATALPSPQLRAVMELLLNLVSAVPGTLAAMDARDEPRT